MRIKEIYQLAIKMGIEADFRGEEAIKELLRRRREKYEKLSEQEKAEFDIESLTNPYSDTRILNVAQDKEIKKVLVGIDIEPAEILLANELGDIDLIISHHPIGKALADLHEVMELQCDILNHYGVPINIAEGLMRPRIDEVARGINARNHQRTVDAARLLGFNLMCCHTVTDNLAAQFLKEKIEQKNGELIRLEDLLNLLKNIPEYQKASKIAVGPRIFVGDPERRCGKIALTEITGGTEGSPKLYEKMAHAGIGTVVGMHVSEEHKKEAEAAHLNVVIAGHMSSDSLGMNLFLDELEKKGIEIIPCSGLIRVSRVK
jgi:putative NIF3 family GTP cyclohydrolase 1 type 2